MCVLLSILPSAQAQQNNQQNTGSTHSGTTYTCALPGAPAEYDVLVATVTSTVAASGVPTDTLLNTFVAKASATNPGGSNIQGAFAYIYVANQTHAAGPDTFSISFGSTALGGMSCFDLVGSVGGRVGSSTGTGTMSGNGTSSFVSSVSTITPAAGNFIVSVAAGSVCQSRSSITYPPLLTPTTSGTYTPGFNSGTQITNPGTAGNTCQETNGHTFATVGAMSWNLTATGSATTQPYTFAGSDSILGCHRSGCSVQPVANWAESAVVLPARVVNSKSVTQTDTMTISSATPQIARTQTDALYPFAVPPQIRLSEQDLLSIAYSKSMQLFVEQICQGVILKVNGINTTNTGPQCGPAIPNIVYVVVQPNPLTISFWVFPFIVVGFFTLLHLVIPIRAGATTWARNYMALTGLVIGCLIAIVSATLEFVILLLALILWFYYAYRG